MIGRHLCPKLKERGFNVIILSRTNKQIKGVTTFYWNPDKKEIDPKAIETADFIIHLAGTNIGEKRWSKKRKLEIRNSRINSGQFILNKIKEKDKKPEAFISASATGYYGSSPDKLFTESDLPANDFLGETCMLWERMADRFKELRIRTVKIRNGLVLAKHQGALSKMILPINLGIGSAIGNGNQYISWIHIDDLSEIYFKAIVDLQMNGAYNAVAPDIKTNKEFIRILAHVLKKPYWFPDIPSVFIKLLFGEMSQLILNGCKVSPGKILAAGFVFKFPELKAAFGDLLLTR